MNKPLFGPTNLLRFRTEQGAPQTNPFVINRSGSAPPPEYVEYWRAVMQRKWSILALAVMAGVLTTVVVFQITPRFRSTALVLIESSKAKVVQVEDVYSGISANREYFQTQAEVIKSRDVALRVVRSLGLVNHPEFDPRQRKRMAVENWLRGQAAIIDSLFPNSMEDADEQLIEAAVLRKFASRLSVEPIRLSQLIRVNFSKSRAGVRG